MGGAFPWYVRADGCRKLAQGGDFFNGAGDERFFAGMRRNWSGGGGGEEITAERLT